MRRRSWEQINEIVEDLKKTGIALCATASVRDIYNLTPTLWVDFLNTDQQNPQSVWSIYKEFTRAIEDLKDWMTEKEYQYGHEMKDVGLLAKEEFLEQYPSELQADAKRIQSGMREIIDSGKASDVIKYPLDHKSIESMKEVYTPPLFLEVDVTKFGSESNQPYLIELKTPEADHPNFWFTVILGGMFSSFREGKIARRCAAEDCGIYFIPSPRSHGQKYHSQTCQNRDYMRRWRSH